jgi:diguanylate cyclase (GGDEF)-like protein
LYKNGGWGRIVLTRRSAGRSTEAKLSQPRRVKAGVAATSKSGAKPKSEAKAKKPGAGKAPGAKSTGGTRTGARPRKPAGGKGTPAVAGRSAAAADTALRRARAAIRNLKAELAEARARIDELQAWADTDFLLDVFNRRGFERELARALAYIRRYSGSGALVVLDVDGLKPINDTFGHAAGDVVLKGIVAVLMRHVRSSDVVGRLGGDEFGVLLWNLDEASALAKAAALESAIDQLTFAFRGRSIVAGASAGIAMLDANCDATAVLDAADRAMYARKLLRKNVAAAETFKR